MNKINQKEEILQTVIPCYVDKTVQLFARTSFKFLTDVIIILCRNLSYSVACQKLKLTLVFINTSKDNFYIITPYQIFPPYVLKCNCVTNEN